MAPQGYPRELPRGSRAAPAAHLRQQGSYQDQTLELFGEVAAVCRAHWYPLPAVCGGDGVSMASRAQEVAELAEEDA